jgi:hypothetical protein
MPSFPRLVPIDTIDTERFQVRPTDHATMKSYASAMRAGAEFPPVTLAENGRKQYLIDGFHRVQAARLVGAPTILATSQRMPLNAALLAALASNQDHGRSMTTNDKQAAWRRYLDADLHLYGAGAVKSLSKIATECPFYSRGHIGKLLQKEGINAPREDIADYRPLDEQELSAEDLELEQVSLLGEFNRRLDAAMETYSLLDDPARAEAFAKFSGLAAGLRPAYERLLNI